MQKIQDQSGNLINGIYRDSIGAIVAERGDSYNKYLQDKKRAEQITCLSDDLECLKGEMTEIKSMLLELLKKKG